MFYLRGKTEDFFPKIIQIMHNSRRLLENSGKQSLGNQQALKKIKVFSQVPLKYPCDIIDGTSVQNQLLNTRTHTRTHAHKY